MTKVAYHDLAHHSGVYTRKEIVEYFNILNKNLNSSHLKHHVTFKLQNAGNEVDVTYSPKKNKWTIQNTNSLHNAKKEYDVENEVGNKMAPEIASILGLKELKDLKPKFLRKIKDKIVLTTIVNGALVDKEKLHKILYCCSRDNQWLKIHNITSSKANYRDENKERWLEAAIFSGEQEVTKELLRKMHFYNKNPKINAISLILTVILVGGGTALCATGFVPLGLTLYSIAIFQKIILNGEEEIADNQRIITAANNNALYLDLLDRADAVNDELSTCAELFKSMGYSFEIKDNKVKINSVVDDTQQIKTAEPVEPKKETSNGNSKDETQPDLRISMNI